MLYVFVEGTDDSTFFEQVLKPIFESKYDSIRLIECQEMKSVNQSNYIKSITSMKYDYYYLKDYDNSKCVTSTKQRIKKKIKNIIEDRIIVVKKEIESWYLAGIDSESCKIFKIYGNNTDEISKEEFDSLIPGRFQSRIDFMSEILKKFSIEDAKKKNTSFRHFIEKHCGSNLSETRVES